LILGWTCCTRYCRECLVLFLFLFLSFLGTTGSCLTCFVFNGVAWVIGYDRVRLCRFSIYVYWENVCISVNG
jgi:hypothetical protein